MKTSNNISEESARKIGTPLRVAEKGGHEDVAEFLREPGAQP